MTSATRNLLLSASFASAIASDQSVMDAYLGSISRKAYESRFANAPEFYAVLATAEYHEHWARLSIIAAPSDRVTACPRSEVCGMVLPDLLKVSL